MNSASNIRSWNNQDKERPFDLLRWGAMIGGGALAVLGLSRRSKSGFALAAAGGVLAYGGATLDAEQKFHAESSFAIACSPEKAYQFWRNFENLPRFMRHLESVNVVDDRFSEWNAFGRFGMNIHWTAEIVEEKQAEWIVWRSVLGSDIDCRGSVHFRPDVGGRGTIVTAAMQYRPPAGAIGKAVATMVGKDPEFMIREDLRRFKALMEAGEIPKVGGQTHGRRSASGKGIQAVYTGKGQLSEFETNLHQVETQRSAS